MQLVYPQILNMKEINFLMIKYKIYNKIIKLTKIKVKIPHKMNKLNVYLILINKNILKQLNLVVIVI